MLTLGCSPKSPSQPPTPSNAPSPPAVAATADPEIKADPEINTEPIDEPPFQDRMAQAIRLLDRGAYDDAWSEVKQLMIAQPKNPELLFVAARVMAARKDLRGAIQLISQIPSESPQGAPAAGQAAEWMVKLGDLDAAESKLLSLANEYQNAVPVLRLLAKVYNAQGRRWESRRYLERLIRLGDFTTGELLATVDYRDYYTDESTYAAFAAQEPKNPYVRFSAMRAKLLRNGYAANIDELMAMAQNHPAMLEAWVWTATSLLELERYPELTQWLKQPRPGSDKHPEYWYALGGLMLEQQRYDNAARCFAECIALDRRHVAGYQGLASAMLELEQVATALRVRQFGNDLVSINDYAQQIAYAYGTPDLYGTISEMYVALGDEVAAFGWSAAEAIVRKLPMTDALKERQRELRKGLTRPPAVLEGLSIAEWPLPEMGATSIPSTEPTSNEPSSISQTGGSEIRMQDVAEELGVNGTYDNGAAPDRGWFTVEGIGGGANVLDYDRDGWPDLVFSQAGASPTETDPQYQAKTMYRSQSGAGFAEVSMAAGLTDRGFGQGMGVSDVDQDGFADILMANLGVVRIYRNNGDGTFEVREIPQPDPNSLWNSSIHAADLNGDQLPDLIVGSYIYGQEAITRWCETPRSQRGSCNPKIFPPGKNRILFSDGQWNWTVADQDLLDAIQRGYTLGTLVTNIDGQYGNDLFFANDVSPNALLLSQPELSSTQGVPEKWALIERAATAGVAVDSIGQAQACMGIACGDQNRDGLLDIIVTNYYNEVSNLYLQNLPGVFVDGTRRSKLGIATMEQLSFGCQLTDLDNDGWLDFIAVNGHIDDLREQNVPWKMPTQILKNEGGVFRWLKNPSPGPYFDGLWIGRGLSMLDFNRDGRPDLVATHMDRAAALLKNTTQSDHHYLQLELVGTQSDREAIGARVRIECGDEFWVTAMNDGEGFFGSNERLLHIGLGAKMHVDRIKIDWPCGTSEVWENLQADARYRLIEGIAITPIDLR